MKLVKRIALVLVVGFAVFYLVTRPQDAANAVQGAVDAVWGAGVADHRLLRRPRQRVTCSTRGSRGT